MVFKYDRIRRVAKVTIQVYASAWTNNWIEQCFPSKRLWHGNICTEEVLTIVLRSVIPRPTQRHCLPLLRASAVAVGAPAWSEVRHGVGAATAGDVRPGDGYGSLVRQHRACSKRSRANRTWGERKSCLSRNFDIANTFNRCLLYPSRVQQSTTPLSNKYRVKGDTSQLLIGHSFSSTEGQFVVGTTSSRAVLGFLFPGTTLLYVDPSRAFISGGSTPSFWSLAE